MERNKKILLVAGAIIVAFLAGFLWQYMAASTARADLAAAQRQVTLHELEGTLAAADIAAHRGTFEVARQLASEFYTDLQTARADIDMAAPDEIDAILAERDATITMLSRGDPRSAEILDQQYSRLRVAIGGPDRALPVAAPVTAAPQDSI